MFQKATNICLSELGELFEDRCAEPPIFEVKPHLEWMFMLE